MARKHFLHKVFMCDSSVCFSLFIMLHCAADGLLSPFLRFRFRLRPTVVWGQQLCRVGVFNFFLSTCFCFLWNFEPEKILLVLGAKEYEYERGEVIFFLLPIGQACLQRPFTQSSCLTWGVGILQGLGEHCLGRGQMWALKSFAFDRWYR